MNKIVKDLIHLLFIKKGCKYIMFKIFNKRKIDNKFDKAMIKILLDTRDLSTLSDVVVSNINANILSQFLKECKNSDRPVDQYYGLFNRLGNIKYKMIDLIIQLDMKFLLPCVHSFKSLIKITKSYNTYFDIVNVIQEYCNYGYLNESILIIYDSMFNKLNIHELYGNCSHYVDNLCKSLFDIIGYDNRVLATALNRKYDLSREIKLKCIENEINLFTDDEICADIICHYLTNSNIRSCEIFNNFQRIMDGIYKLVDCNNSYFKGVLHIIEESCITNANNLKFIKNNDPQFIYKCISNTVIPLHKLTYVKNVQLSDELLRSFIVNGGDVSTIPQHRLTDNIVEFIIQINPDNAIVLPKNILQQVKLKYGTFDKLISSEKCMSIFNRVDMSVMIGDFGDYIHYCTLNPKLPNYYVPIINDILFDKTYVIKKLKDSLKYLTDMLMVKIGTPQISQSLQNGIINFWDINIPYNTFNILTIKQVIKNSYENINHMATNTEMLHDIISLYT